MGALLLLLLSPLIMLGVVFLAIFLDLILAFPLMLAWNHVIPGLFGLHALGYWQAFSLLIVSTLLVKSLGAAATKSEK